MHSVARVDDRCLVSHSKLKIVVIFKFNNSIEYLFMRSIVFHNMHAYTSVVSGSAVPFFVMDLGNRRHVFK